MPNLVIDLLVSRVDLVDEGANTAAFIKLYKRKEQDTNMTIDEILAKMQPEHAEVITKAMADAKAEVPAGVETALEESQEELKKEQAKFQSAFDELDTMKRAAEVAKGKPDFEEVLKGLEPAAQEVMKSLLLAKEAAEAEVRKAKQKELQDEAVAKAKELTHLPVEQEKLVEVLKTAPQDVLDIFKAVNKLIEDGGVLEEVGKRGDQGGSPGDAQQAWAQIEKKADEIAKRDNITREKAVGIAVRENAELYKAYLDGGAN